MEMGSVFSFPLPHDQNGSPEWQAVRECIDSFHK
jgi:hypothetical protein